VFLSDKDQFPFFPLFWFVLYRPAMSVVELSFPSYPAFNLLAPLAPQAIHPFFRKVDFPPWPPPSTVHRPRGLFRPPLFFFSCQHPPPSPGLPTISHRSRTLCSTVYRDLNYKLSRVLPPWPPLHRRSPEPTLPIPRRHPLPFFLKVSG